MDNLQAFVDAAERCRGGDDPSAVSERKAAWEEIVRASGKTIAQLADEVASALGVNKITVRRWILGENVPRSAMFDRIREYFGVESAAGFPYIKPEAPIPFEQGNAAIWTVNQWVKLLEFADCAFVCKGLMPLRAANDFHIRNFIEAALTANENLVIYYVVVEGSDADKAYQDMIALIKDYGEKAVLKNLRKIVLKRDEDFFGLWYSYASPFVVKYHKDHWKRYQRRVNILYEVPVDSLSSDGRQTQSDALIAYLQLPFFYIQRAWEMWAAKLIEKRYIRADNDELTTITPDDRLLHFGL